MANPQSDVRTPEQTDLLLRVAHWTAKDLHVALPAQVQSYDPATQTCTVAPVLQHAEVDADGGTVMENYPVISGVPVIFPGAGGMRIVFPLRTGDFVLLVFSDRSMDLWKSYGGSSVNPLILGQHEINDAVAIPGLHPNNAPWSLPRTDSTYIGQDGGPQIEITPSNINLGPGATAAVARVGDDVTITAAEIASLGLMAGTNPVTAPSPTNTATAKISSGSSLVNSE